MIDNNAYLYFCRDYYMSLLLLQMIINPFMNKLKFAIKFNLSQEQKRRNLINSARSEGILMHPLTEFSKWVSNFQKGPTLRLVQGIDFSYCVAGCCLSLRFTPACFT